MPLRIDPIKIELPDWSEIGGLDWTVLLIEKISRMVRDTGTTSDAFLQRKREIRLKAMEGQPFESLVKSRRDARIVSILWAEDQRFIKVAPPSDESLRIITSRFSKPSQQVLINLLELYFVEFDRIQALSTLRATISNMMRVLGSRFFIGDLAKIFEHREMLMEENAAETFVEWAFNNNKEFEQSCHDCGLSVSKGGRFLELAKQKYYLETISSLEVGAGSYVFDEVISKSTKESPSERQGEFFGHDVIRAMLDRVNEANATMPENWIQVVLNIGGDPRLPKGSSNYQKWWSPLEGRYRDMMLRWLSKYDLNLFLRVLEESSNTPAMRRMFPARRRFLEGLEQSGFVVESRLFLSHAAREFVRRVIRKRHLPYFEELGDTNTSVIYLRLTKCHLVEGTHNYSLWLYDELPDKNPIDKARYGGLYARELGMGMKEQYEEEKGPGREDGPPYRIIHHTNVTWQNKAISSMRKLGLRVDPESVLPKEDYEQYLIRFGG